ncbi:MAG TPA: HD domain-containing protein [Devosia sp.]|jgi:(p)ppGpp synthase/HD superfamily hydrolase|nr:HD domain-containing protein [Devosia sp.]
MPNMPNPSLSSLEEEALVFARDAHASIGQVRKYTGEPYIVHPVAVAAIVKSVPHTDEMVAAALMHDVVEDTPVTLREIRERFGDTVADLVDWLTDVSRPSDGVRRVRKRLDLEHSARAPAEAQTIKLADLIDNSRTISTHDVHFWPVYRREMLDLIDAMKLGHATLRAQAIASAGSRTPGRSRRR